MPVDPAIAKQAGRPRASRDRGAAEACRELITAYFHLSDAGDIDALGELVADDFELGEGPTVVRGKAAVVDLLRSRRQSTPGRRKLHLLGSVQMLQVGERDASSFAVLGFYDSNQPAGGSGLQLVGFYESHDAYALGAEGRWKLTRHRVEAVSGVA